MKKFLIWLAKVAALGILAFFLYRFWGLFLFIRENVRYSSIHIQHEWRLVNCITIPLTAALYIFACFEVSGVMVYKSPSEGRAKKFFRAMSVIVPAVGVCAFCLGFSTIKRTASDGIYMCRARLAEKGADYTYQCQNNYIMVDCDEKKLTVFADQGNKKREYALKKGSVDREKYYVQTEKKMPSPAKKFTAFWSIDNECVCIEDDQLVVRAVEVEFDGGETYFAEIALRAGLVLDERDKLVNDFIKENFTPIPYRDVEDMPENDLGIDKDTFFVYSTDESAEIESIIMYDDDGSFTTFERVLLTPHEGDEFSVIAVIPYEDGTLYITSEDKAKGIGAVLETNGHVFARGVICSYEHFEGSEYELDKPIKARFENGKLVKTS